MRESIRGGVSRDIIVFWEQILSAPSAGLMFISVCFHMRKNFNNDLFMTLCAEDEHVIRRNNPAPKPKPNPNPNFGKTITQTLTLTQTLLVI